MIEAWHQAVNAGAADHAGSPADEVTQRGILSE